MIKHALTLILSIILLSAPSYSQNQAPEKSKSLITVEGVRYYVHSVQKGETLSSIARLYGTDVASIVKANPHAAEILAIGQLIKVPAAAEIQQTLSPKRMNRLFETHTVNKGETAYSIAKRYEISVNTLMEDNPGFDPAVLSIGQRINIRKKEMGETSPAEIDAQMQEYKATLNMVSDRFTHHIVEKGETLYSLSKKFGTRVDSIQKYNADQLRTGLQQGSIIKIPVEPSAHKGEACPPGGSPQAPPADSTPGAIQPGSLFPSDTTGTEISSDGRSVINVVMMLPLDNTAQSKSFVEFYNGALVALEQLKAQGISTRVDLFDTGRSAEKTQQILSSYATEVADADLIIGPVYEECFDVVAEFARRHRIPVVSPLAPLSTDANQFTYQIAPPQETKSQKLRELLTPDKNIVLISTESNDPEFRQEVEAALPATGVTHLNYSRATSVAALENIIKKDRDNIFIVLSSNENVIDEMLARISSIQTNLIARSIMNPYIKVVGSSKWTRFRNIDKNLFFKLELSYVSNYHADRTNPLINAFNRTYIRDFGAVPTLYSYRGYDVTKLFVSAIHTYGRRMPSGINESTEQLLQVPYRFIQSGRGSKFVNQQWVMTNYKNDYTIEAK